MQTSSGIRSPFLRPERFCHTGFQKCVFTPLDDYHKLMATCCPYQMMFEFHITVSDSRTARGQNSTTLWGIGIDDPTYKYPSHVTAEDFLLIVDKVASEIASIGRERGRETDAQKMIAGLRERKEYGERAILEYCVNLYTQSSFLFRAFHQDLGDYYALDAGKLANYERLLSLYVESYGKSHIGTVYRGAMLNDERLKLHVGSDYYTAWYSNTYLSTSKCRQVAEMFGNTLMIIEIDEVSDNKGKSVDVSELSVFPEEEEVLLTPEYMLFKVKQPEFDSNLNKHIIYLTSTLSSVYSSIVKDENVRRQSRRKRNNDSPRGMFNRPRKGFDDDD
jgi:hypothetical protein